MTVDNTPYFRPRRPVSEQMPRAEPRAWRRRHAWPAAGLVSLAIWALMIALVLSLLGVVA